MMPGKAVLSGGLSFIGLADLFQILGGNNSTGTLRLTNSYVQGSGVIYFVEGNPINASLGSLTGLEAIYPQFGWTDGSFEFHEEEVRAGRVIEQSRMQIVLDALRMLDDGLIKRVGRPSLEDIPEAEKGTPLVIKRPITDYMYVINEEEISDGTDIVKEGGHGKWIWIILEGTVKVTRETANGPLPIVTIGEGGFVGNLASFSFRENLRSATVTAVGKVRLGVLDSDLLYEEFSSFSRDFKVLLISLSKRLNRITDMLLALSTGKIEGSEWVKGKSVFTKRGSGKEGLFAVKGGEVCLVGHTPRGPLPLMPLGKEDVFGSAPFIDMGLEPHSASVMASEDIKVNQLDIQSLHQEYHGTSGTFRSLIDHICTSVSVTTRLAIDLYAKGKEARCR